MGAMGSNATLFKRPGNGAAWLSQMKTSALASSPPFGHAPELMRSQAGTSASTSHTDVARPSSDAAPGAAASSAAMQLATDVLPTHGVPNTTTRTAGNSFALGFVGAGPKMGDKETSVPGSQAPLRRYLSTSGGTQHSSSSSAPSAARTENGGCAAALRRKSSWPGGGGGYSGAPLAFSSSPSPSPLPPRGVPKSVGSGEGGLRSPPPPASSKP
mmetsp:Transcript_145431/g.466023  ORF Transcript_145431/g.466023 Transcript_145431/m.466023 type:complete len:214 (-) Transcript_145431:513-1154(-)